ncbi:hypothetical protein V6N13_038959 [Hibiscus sabdariffa]|uniref:Uncharacterized protein n=1 Tax=Hibiscus sabdariffa TaxID=183260 RepID=A0ABR2SXR6_9ROSI
MCYADVPCGGRPGFLVQRRWFVLRAPMVASANHHAPKVARETGGSTDSMKCLCSPTKHPGSFRCRYHHVEYVWGGRLIGKK